jgi:hypothetical protein
MTLDGSYVELNRAATDRMRDLTARLSDDDLQLPVGEHWTASIALAHIAFWDGRVMYLLDRTERDGHLYVPRVDAAVHEVNDLSLPFWSAIPPREAARLAIEMAAALDRRLEEFSPRLLEEVYEHNERWVLRALHRNEHLDEVEAARGV